MADNYREETATRKRGRSASKLSVRLFLLDPNKDITKVTKEIGSEKGLNELKLKGYGPPSKEHCIAGDKVEFSLELTNEEFKQKLGEIYPSLKNACFVFMKAGKDNTLKELNPGVCCYRCYTPENVYSSERGQGRLYIRIISENEISPCNHGVPLWKRLRGTVGVNQQFFVPIAPKPVAAVVPAPSTTLPSTSAVTSVATPTNYLLSASHNHETELRTALSNLPALDLSSSLISVAQAESKPASQNSGSMVSQTPLLSRSAGTTLPFPSVNLSEKSTVQGPSSISEAATRSEAQSSDNNTVPLSQLAASSITSQSALTPSIHGSVVTSSLSLPSQRINRSVNMIPSQQLPPSSTVSPIASTAPVNGPFNILSQRQLVTLASNALPSQPFGNSVVSQTASTPPVNYGLLPQRQFPTLATNRLPAPSQLFGSSVNMVPQRQSPASSTVSQIAPMPSSRQVQPFVSENITPESQISRSAEDSDESIAQSFINVISQIVAQSDYTSSNTDQELEVPETGSQETNEALRGLHGSNIVPSAVTSHASSRITPSPGLSLLADVVGEAQRERWENSIASDANIQEDLEPEQKESRIVEFLPNVISTGKLEISLDVLNNDALLKKLNESTICIHTVEIQSTCKVDQVLKKLPLPSSCVKVLRIIENILNLGQVSELVKFLTMSNVEVLDMCSTKFKENSFIGFICALYNCKHLTSLILTDNGLTEQEMNSLITALGSVKNLKILNLSKCILTETQANAILNKHEQAKNIVTLDLSHNAIQGNEIVVGICQLQSLEELDLSHNCVRFSPLPNLEGKRNHLSTCLKVISLSSNHMKPDDISWFRSLIRSDLSKLILDFNHVGPSIWSLCSLGERISHLKVLSLANTDICDNVNGLASLLSIVKELEDLNLSSDNLMAEEFQQLQTPLSKLIQLKALNLSMNAIGPDETKALADMFKNIPLLERLDVSSLYIREDEVSILCKSLVSLKKFKYLNLSGNCIDAEVLSDALVLPATLEELFFSHTIHGEKLFAEMKQLQNLRKLHLNKLILRQCDAEALAITLSCFPKLEELSLADLVAPECGMILISIKSLKSIRKIDLTAINLNNEESALIDMLSSCDFLEELVLDHNSGTNIDFERLFCAIKLLKRLRKLCLGDVRVFCRADVKAFLEMCSSLSILKDIVFPDFSFIDADSITGCFKALESLGNLRSLDLRPTIIRESTAGALTDVLPSLQLLEKVDLNPGFHHKSLLDVLGKLRYLKELSYGWIKKADIEAFAHALSSLPLLEKLRLFTDESLNTQHIGQLYAAIGKLKYLRKLDLVPNFHPINDSKVEALAKVLSSLPLLEKLSFSTNRLSNTEHIGELYAAIGKLKYLRKLDVCVLVENPGDDSEAEALAKALPSLELLAELKLELFMMPVTDGGKQVFAAISKLRYLKKLEYTCSYGGYTDVKAFSEMLTSLRLLEKLVFFESTDCINESEEKELLIAVGKLKRLKTLHLGENLEITPITVKALVRALLSLRVLEDLYLEYIYDINGSESEELLSAVGKLKYLKKLTLYWSKMTQTNVDDLVRALASLQVLDKLSLHICFYCNHQCDVNCDDECHHTCYVATCGEYRRDEQKRHMDLTKEKVLELREKRLKYLKKFTLNGEHVI